MASKTTLGSSPAFFARTSASPHGGDVDGDDNLVGELCGVACAVVAAVRGVAHRREHIHILIKDILLAAYHDGERSGYCAGLAAADGRV